MTIALPVSLQCDWLVVRRGGWNAIARITAAPAAIVAVCIALACAWLYAGHAWGLAACGLLALIGSLTVTRWRLAQALIRARFGWCGALPASHRATTAALLAVGVAALVLADFTGTVALVLAARFARHGNAVGFALAAFDGGLAAGFGAAAVYVCCTHAAARVHRADSIREPLLALPWLNDPKLPHLLDWQRRAAVTTWRRGASVILVVPILAMGPDPTSIRTRAGPILWLGTLVWLVVVARASRDVTRDAVGLLGATPRTPDGMRWTALRYLLVAAACATALVCVGAWLSSGGIAVVVWLACAAAATSWPLVDVIRLTSSRNPK